MHLITDAAATLGARFNLIFDPHDHRLYQNAFGSFRECAMELTVGVKTPEGRLWVLPFTDAAPHFPFIEQFDTLTSITYRAVHPELGIELTARLRAPFYPRNVGISTAPFYYLDVSVRRLKGFRWIKAQMPLDSGAIVFELSAAEAGSGDGAAAAFARAKGGFTYTFTSTSPGHKSEAATVKVPVQTHVECPDAEPFGLSGLRKAFDLSTAPEATMSLLWSNWVAEPVLEVFGEKTAFKYQEVFESREEMAWWAGEERERIHERCNLLDRAVEDTSLGGAASHMAALAFHSFLLDTWWTTRKSGDWFSVWEGACYFHSTIDVEYNDALLYLALWPELLGMLLDEWALFEVDGTQTLGAPGKGTGFLCHDMGIDHVVGRQFYPHHMEVEENANYLLMLAAWAFFTNNVARAAKKLDLCRRLAEFILKCDTTGNGIPDRGVANTIDDAGPAVQYGRKQIYLAVKVQAALWALAELEQKCGARNSQAERWRAFASKGIKTVEEEAWLGDHYAVTLTRSTEGLVDPWSGKPLPPGELKGWDAYSIYTANGLLYLFLGGIKMPRWKLNRFADGIESAARATMGPYGCRHSSAGEGTVWFSQNMWRDYVAAYLGTDLLNNVERYWDYQAATGDNFQGALYYDTTEGNNLNFYPRGAVVFGMAMSAAGLGLNRAEGELTLRPLRSTLSVPLLPLADWEGMRVPTLTVRNREGVVVARVSHRDLLAGLKLTVLGAELEPE
jgi:hypothetical protein